MGKAVRFMLIAIVTAALESHAGRGVFYRSVRTKINSVWKAKNPPEAVRAIFARDNIVSIMLGGYPLFRSHRLLPP